jgi:solute carrier family 35 protein F1/2
VVQGETDENDDCAYATGPLSDQVNNGVRGKCFSGALFFGQAISLALASVNAASTTIENRCGLIIPFFQTGIMYLLLSTHLIYPRCHPEKIKKKIYNEQGDIDDREGLSWNQEANLETKRARWTVPKNEAVSCNDIELEQFILPFTNLYIHVPWWQYFIVAFLDVQANNLTMVAFQFTSLASTTLLGSLTIPSVMLASRILLSRVFSWKHFLGGVLCIIGGTMTVWSDSLSGGTQKNNDEDNNSHSISYIGDGLAITGALLYGLNDTFAELFIKKVDRVEYLVMLGLFGALVSFIQGFIFNMDGIAKLFGTDMTLQEKIVALLLLVWFVVALLYYYVAASHFMATYDATVLTLSLQTAPIWAVVFSFMAEQVAPTSLFFVALVFVVLGVIVYEIESPASPKGKLSSSIHNNTQFETSSTSISTISRDQLDGYGSIQVS